MNLHFSHTVKQQFSKKVISVAVLSAICYVPISFAAETLQTTTKVDSVTSTAPVVNTVEQSPINILPMPKNAIIDKNVASRIADLAEKYIKKTVTTNDIEELKKYISLAYGVSFETYSDTGDFPMGEITAFSRWTCPSTWTEADGRLIPLINSITGAINQPAFKFITDGGYVEIKPINGSYYLVMPDLRGRFIRGWNRGSGLDSGRDIGSGQDAGGFIVDRSYRYVTTGRGGAVWDVYPGDVRPINRAFLYCIKTGF